MHGLTAIIPFWNGHDTIWRLLESLPAELPVIIVDDHSDEPLEVDLHGSAFEWRDVRILRSPERGYFSGAVNLGIQACDTDVLVLNQDVWLKGSAWLGQLNDLRDQYGIIGDGVMGHPAWPKGYVQGTFMYVARAVVDGIGLLNERDYPLWGTTCEYQLRACRAGFTAHPTVKFQEAFGHEARPKGSKFGPAITEAIRRDPDNRGLFIRTPPAISVVVPCYNYARYLHDCINSLIGGKTCLGPMEGQSFQSFEIIIVDDASTDETRETGQALADPWKGIRYIRHRRNRGTPSTLNTGVEAARGQYITILSADDMLEPWHLDTLYQVCEAYPGRVAYGHLMQVKSGQRDRPLKLPNYDFERLLKKNPMSAGIMYPKKAWRDAGGYPVSMIHGREDWAFNIALGIKGWCGMHTGGKPGYLIRREKQNRSLTTATPDWFGFFRKQLVALFPEIYSGERPMGCCSGRRSPAQKSSGTSRKTLDREELQRMTATAGTKGMALIVFQRDINAPKTFYGPVTGAAYQFGGKRKVGRVDLRDLETKDTKNPGFLEMFDKGNELFRQAVDAGKPPAKRVVKASEPKAKPKPDAEVEPDADVEAEAKPEVVTPSREPEPEELVDLLQEPIDLFQEPYEGDLNPRDMTVGAIRDLSGSLTLQQWQTMRQLEEVGKSRKSAMDFMDAAIRNLKNLGG